MFDFGPAIDVLHGVFGVPAEYYPAGGPKFDCTVIRRTPATEGALLSAGMRLSTERQKAAIEAAVRVSEVGDRILRREDTLVIKAHTIGGRSYPEQPYTVIQEPELDSEKLEWRLTLREGRK